jgi:uncharacterized membrane protein
MRWSQLHYLPLPLPFFFILVGLFLLVVALIEIGVLRFAYMRIGLSSRAAMLLLLGTLIGSYINIPVAELPGQQVMSGEEIDYFGMRYVVPTVVDWPGTIIAVNVGGAIIPVLLSLYLLGKHQLWGQGLVATLGVAVVCHWLAHPVRGLGIAEPVFAPPIAAAIAALLLSYQRAAPLAYIGGSLGTLIGADVSNLDKVQGLGAPVASIGGAGTFDGIFLTGILAVLLASLFQRTDVPRSDPGSQNIQT